MKCSGIRKLLPDYLEHELDPRTEQKVKEHLSSCEKCTEALAFYKRYFKEVKAVRTKDAPEDFLERIKDRMRTTRPLKDLFSKIFLPFHIKVPIELAGVAALIIIIILVIKPVQQIYQVKGTSPEISNYAMNKAVEKTPHRKILDIREEPLPSESDKDLLKKAQSLAGEKERPETRSLKAEGPEGKLAESPKKTSINKLSTDEELMPSKDDGILNIALVPRETEKTGTGSKLSTESSAPASFAKGAAGEEKEITKAEEMDQTTSAQLGKKKAKSISEDQGLAILSDQKKDRAKQAAKLLVFSTNDVIRINAIVTNLKGRIIPDQQKRMVRAQQYLIIEIPAGNYGQLLDQLNKDYSVQKPFRKFSSRDQEKARIQLQKQSDKE